MADNTRCKPKGDPKGQGKASSHEDIIDEEHWGVWGPAGKGKGKDKGQAEGKGEGKNTG